MNRVMQGCYEIKYCLASPFYGLGVAILNTRIRRCEEQENKALREGNGREVRSYNFQLIRLDKQKENLLTKLGDRRR